MRKFYSAIMALSVLLFASCDKNEGDIGTTDDGIQTKMGLTISFPETSTTKAADDARATAPDVAVNTITVYVFESNGKQATKGGYTKFIKAGSWAGTFNVIDNKEYTLDASKLITTTSGTKKIYVGFNLPAALDANTVTEDILINEASTSGLWVDGATGHVAMLGSETATLETNTDGTSKTNEVAVTVKRTVAKIAVNKGSAENYNVVNGAADGGTFTVTPDKYTVGNLIPKFYPVQRLDGSNNLVTPAYTVAVAPGTQVDLNANGKAPGDLTTAFYVPERAPKNLQKEATYTVVRAKLTITHMAKLVGEVITLTSGAPTGGPIKVVTNGIDTYFCAPADANAVATKLIGSKIYEYEDAGSGTYYTFYHVFINDKENPAKGPRLAIYRNYIYHLTIDGVSGIGVPGKPGDPGEPPVDPPGPGDPVYEEDTNLKVIITIADWEYDTQAVILKPW